MEQNLHTPEMYDYRQYDRIWQRVAPTLEPYPGMRQTTAEMAADPVATIQETMGQSGMRAANVGVNGDGDTAPQSAMTAAREAMLPGAEMNPCCMGTAAADMLEVLTGFIEEELADRRQLLALSRQAPGWARQQLRDMANAEGQHARKLMAAYYLITGSSYQPAINCERIYVGRWCPALRERYHAAACSGLNYMRAAEESTDPCLQRLLKGLGADEYRHADRLLCLLEHSMRE